MSRLPQSSENYLSRIRNLALSRNLSDIVTSLSKRDQGCTRFFYMNSNGRLYPNTTTEIIARAKKDVGTYGPTVCIVENISPECIGALGSAWELNPEFFLNHASNPKRGWTTLWQQRIFNKDQYASSRQRESSWELQDCTDASSESYSERKYDYIDGNFVYDGISVCDTVHNSAPNYFKRHIFPMPWEDQNLVDPNAMCSNTRISYYRVKEYLYLFLVDAPLHLQIQYRDTHRRIRPSLRLPYATNCSGLILPQLLEKDNQDGKYYSIFKSLDRVFRERWRRELLISQGSEVFPAKQLCYMLSDSLWLTNLRNLTREIRRISFDELRELDFTINDRLHDHREDLVAFLISGLEQTTANIPKDVREFWESLEHKLELNVNGTSANPVLRHEKMLHEAEKLERFLMDTFQLLISATNVQDAKMSIAQGKRVTQLTVLASIFISLSFVTGIFGMNLKEINGSALSVWVFSVAAVGALTATGIGFLGLQIYSKRKSKVGGKLTENLTDIKDKENSSTKKHVALDTSVC